MSVDSSITGPHTRREFLRRSALVAGAGIAAPWALNLSGWATSASADDDYRALVCVFLYGGNDAYDTFIPNDPDSYATYQAARGTLARPRDTVLDVDPIGGFQGAGTFGFAPELAELKGLFDTGDLAVMSNIGTLIRPLDKSSYALQSNRPPQLFSHNDQQSFWQASSPEGARTGWGGRIADLVLDGNGSNSTFTCVSVAGNAVLMNGRDAFQYQVSPRGVTQLNASSYRHDAVLAGIREVMELQQSGMFPSSYTDLGRRALDAADGLGVAVDTAAARYDLTSYFDVGSQNRTLANTASQLAMVARLIAAGRDTLGMKRQVFFVGVGGFDNHSGLATGHRTLLAGLDGALAGFYRATQSLGIANGVTTFTASDFGRTLASNGDGSDHGWGSHHIVMGGSVAGNRVYGRVPEVADDGPDDVGHGRLLPSTSVDQYAATMATWMGAGASELDVIVPNIGRYDAADLGFLTSPTTVGAGDGVDDPARALRPATRLTLP